MRNWLVYIVIIIFTFDACAVEKFFVLNETLFLMQQKQGTFSEISIKYLEFNLSEDEQWKDHAIKFS